MGNPAPQIGEIYSIADRTDQKFGIIKFEEFCEEDIVFHSHDFVEICYVFEGCGCHCVNDKRHLVSKGDLFIINYDMTHTFFRAADCEKLVTFNLLLASSFLDNLQVDFSDFDSSSMSFVFNDLWNACGDNEAFHLSLREQFEFDALFEKMNTENTKKKPGYKNIISAGVTEMLTMIMRHFSHYKQSDTAIQKKSAVIESIKNYLHVNFSSGFDLEDLARKSFFSKNYLCKIFKEITGHTISDYMIRLRINEACEMLKDPNKKILSIALEVGFSDYKSFNVAFKRIMNISASEYRQQYNSTKH